MNKRLSYLFVAVAFLVVSCAPSGEPDDYDDTVQENFVEACVATGEQTQQLEDALVATCECAYEKFADTVPYADFKDFDDTLRGDPEAQFPAEYETIFADCIRDAA